MTIPSAGSGVLSMSHADYAAQLFKTSLFSDCTIYSQSRVWHLHRCILSPRCEFFWSCFQGSFEEAGSAVVEMHDDEPETLDRMLRWIYVQDYPKLSNDGNSWTRDLQLYQMADKYGLTSLMDVIKKALLQLADRCSADPQLLARSADDLADAFDMLFEELSDQQDFVVLRTRLMYILAPAMAKHMRTLPVLEELMSTIPGFGLALVESLAPQRADRRRTSSIDSISLGSQNSNQRSSPPATKPYIPLNEDSEDEYA